jgi:hypothetical protein
VTVCLKPYAQGYQRATVLKVFIFTITLETLIAPNNIFIDKYYITFSKFIYFYTNQEDSAETKEVNDGKCFITPM